MIRIRMVKITTEQFEILTQTPVSGEFGVTLNVTPKHAAAQKQIGVLAEFSFSENNTRFMFLSVFCEFAILPEDWDKCITDGIVSIPKETMEYFVVQTIGTSRGILHCKTEGTIMNNIVLPSFDVSNAIQEDYRFAIGAQE